MNKYGHIMTEFQALFQNAKAWPFEEARALLKHLGGKLPEKGYVLFETGYGPSGLPHIGTFGEVARTSMVRHAFEILTGMPTRLFAFSDDMDGLRKVPDNIPNPELLAANLNMPLTKVPDPFGKFESFGHHNNAMLRDFLDRFGFSYEFKSATECYQSGLFDEALLKVLQNYDKIMAIMLPTLGAERQKTYSPFLPICPTTGRVLQVPVLERNLEKGTIVFEDESGKKQEVSVTGGNVKLQWKPDWGMRWAALGVDYEMFGKDLIDSAHLATKICRTIGGKPPQQFQYEHFLDEEGQKISKSKGNGLTIEDWLRYAPEESLALYMYQKPRVAKRLYFDVIPRAVDEYLTFNEKYGKEEKPQQLENPVWHIHRGEVEHVEQGISFNLLLNLAGAANTEETSVLWGFINQYDPSATKESQPFLDKLVNLAINYYQDFIKPTKKFRAPSDKERAAILELAAELKAVPTADHTSDHLQTLAFSIGKKHEFEDLKSWFGCLYEVLLGQTQGPRMGSFIAFYGVANTIALIEDRLN